MAVAEAMAVGLPVVSTPVACVRSVMRPNIDGIAVRPGDAVELAEALTTLLTSEASWNRFARAGQEAVQRLTWDKGAEATMALYGRASAGRPLREQPAT
jgi:glycosyltransferase involved in cell wall biosynthesis